MSLSLRYDLRAQSELLTFLVISHLATRHTTGNWMSARNVVESVLFWPNARQSEDDVIRRAMLASRALPLAELIESETSLLLDGRALATMFDERLNLNFSSLQTAAIYERCLNHLMRVKWYV
jgi:hypothetical protein